MKYLIFISLFLIQFVFGEEDPSFEEELNDIPEGGGVSFPNFRRFYLQEGGFDFSVPAADLELSLFSINEEARNFPEEAVEERLAKERNRRRSKRHIPGSPKQFFNRPSFDSVFFDAFSNSIFFRDPRKAQRPNRRPPPVYPPRDPFGTTEYIPLPPSNPGHALPLTHENPHFKPGRGGRGQRFRGRLPRKAFFHGLPSFLYDSSNDFRTHENQVVSAIKSVP